eukprot:SAG31_NODE_1963_length_6802_cov_2.758168_1_plen_119_part_10
MGCFSKFSRLARARSESVSRGLHAGERRIGVGARPQRPHSTRPVPADQYLVPQNTQPCTLTGITSLAPHINTMAQGHACTSVMWVHSLLYEMGFPKLVEEPTPMLGDNDQATMLAIDDH